MQQAAGKSARATNRRDFFRKALGQPERQVVPAPPRAPSDILVDAPVHWADPRMRLLRRATMGVTSSDVMDISTAGYQRWLNDQVNYERINDDAVEQDVAAQWPLLSGSPVQLAGENNGDMRNQLQRARLYRAVYSPRQLFERMVEFWTDHFSISIDRVGYLKLIDDREVIRRHALGRFSDLLYASAKSPAMLAYLDQNRSRRGSPNENYVRELMELHTLGVDGGYTQQDVSELARVFTGWTFSGAGEFTFNPSLHDFGAKTVLGVNIPETNPSIGSAGIQEGEQMLDVLLAHPSTGRFLATKMLKWMVTPEPTEVQINAIAGAYRATGGDIKRMVRAVLNEGWISQAPAKLKRPFHLVVSSLRATSAVLNKTDNMVYTVRNIGQPLFQWETPDGFPDTTEYWVGNIAPRWSFGTGIAYASSDTNVNIDVSEYLAGTPQAAVERLNSELFAGELEADTRAGLLAYLEGGTFNNNRLRETLGLALNSYEFQWY